MKTAIIPLTTFKDARVEALASLAEHKILAIWAADCAVRVMPFFEKTYPADIRPHIALQTLQKWIETGEFKMAVIRKSSLDAHAAAREVGKENAARSAARSAGQAVATAHMPRHAIGASIYALQAVYRSSDLLKAEMAVNEESERQFQRLLRLSRRLP